MPPTPAANALRPRPTGGPGGELPDPPACLHQVELTRLTADPESTAPFGDPVTLRWDVDIPTGCGVRLAINGAPIAATGSMTVEPAQTTPYSITASARGFRRTLGRVVVRVDTARCISGSLTEQQVSSALRAAVARADASIDEVTLRRAPTVEVDAKGIHVAIRMKVRVPNFTDPELDIDLSLGVRTRDGAVEVFLRRFAVDLDWPWWVTGLSLGISKIVEEVLEDKIEGELRAKVVDAAQGAIDSFVEQLPGDLAVHRVVTAPDRVDVTVCPAGSNVTHLVLGRGVLVEDAVVLQPT